MDGFKPLYIHKLTKLKEKNIGTKINAMELGKQNLNISLFLHSNAHSLDVLI